MQYQVDTESGITRVVLSGVMNYSDQAAYRDISKIIQGASSPVVIDVSEVGGADTAALGFFVLAHSEAKRRGVDFQVANPVPQVKQLMQAARLDRMIDIA
ncbi:STAS domain-containing protein [Azospirillum sp. sgz302134]